MQPEGRCTSDPMFIRVSPLLVYLHPPIWHILSPVAKSSASLNMLAPRFLAILPKRSNVAYVLKYIASIKWQLLNLKPRIGLALHNVRILKSLTIFRNAWFSNGQNEGETCTWPAFTLHGTHRCRPSHLYIKTLCRQRENVRDGQMCVMLFTLT